MKAKQILTLVLTVFVVGSVAALVFNETKSAPVPVQASPTTAEEQTAVPDRQVIAYYFHGTARCITCKTIEAQTEEALKTGFPEALQDGRLVWRVVNVEEPGNGHFVTDYQLHTKSVVLSDVQGGHEAQWKNLDQVWNLVGSKESFIAYIQHETENLLGENNG